MRAIWKRVYGEDRPLPDGRDTANRDKDSANLDRKLNAALREEGRWAREFYLMASAREVDNPLNDPQVIGGLQKRLPSLKMIAFGVEGEGEALVWDEYNLSETVRSFLITLRGLE